MLSQYFIGIVAFVVLEVIHLMGLPVWALLVVRFTAVDLGRLALPESGMELFSVVAQI